MDDVDAVQAQIAANMVSSGDWVTARLDGVAYLEKSPLLYWMIALFFKFFIVADWVARLPIALACVGLALLTAAFARWAFGAREALYAGLVIATCIGLFLFTRILIPDVILTSDDCSFAVGVLAGLWKKTSRIQTLGCAFWRCLWAWACC